MKCRRDPSAIATMNGVDPGVVEKEPMDALEGDDAWGVDVGVDVSAL